MKRVPRILFRSIRFLNVLRLVIGDGIVGREAFDAEVIEKFADISRLVGGPAVVGREKLDVLIAKPRHLPDRARQIFLQ